MPVYAFYSRDGEDAARIRPTIREAHFEHIFTHVSAYRMGGPLKKDGEAIGSLVMIEADDDAHARASFEQDPYYVGGVWHSINVTEFEFLTGTWRPSEDGVCHASSSGPIRAKRGLPRAQIHHADILKACQRVNHGRIRAKETSRTKPDRIRDIRDAVLNRALNNHSPHIAVFKANLDRCVLRDF